MGALVEAEGGMISGPLTVLEDLGRLVRGIKGATLITLTTQEVEEVLVVREVMQLKVMVEMEVVVDLLP